MIDENEKLKLKITVQALANIMTRTGQQPNKKNKQIQSHRKQQTYRQKNRKHNYKQTEQQIRSGQTHTERLTKSEK